MNTFFAFLFLFPVNENHEANTSQINANVTGPISFP